MPAPRAPASTYRVQLNRGFRFEDARRLVPYLHRLGVAALYASPILQARSGSGHGYDITDPTRLNPELGSEDDLKELSRDLKTHGMGLLLDIVPNHLAASLENPWWRDALEHGPTSPHAATFDLAWHWGPQGRRSRLALPVLGRPLKTVLQQGDLRLDLDEEGLSLRYLEQRFPVDVRSYRRVLSSAQRASTTSSPENRRLQELLGRLRRLVPFPGLEGEAASQRYREARALKRDFLGLVGASPLVGTRVREGVGRLNGTPNLLRRLVDEQPYRLAYWRRGLREINYRRFFDIADLVGVRVEDSQVFEVTHKLVMRLVEEGMVAGLRVDHVDGLRDPQGYLERLRGRTGSATYLAVEKILGQAEVLPEAWPVQGTTGYDFLNALNGLFVDGDGSARLRNAYSGFTGSAASFAEVVYEQKKRVMAGLFSAEVRRLGQRLAEMASEDRHEAAIPREALMAALVEMMACLPIYRTYVGGPQVADRERGYIERAVRDARLRAPHLQPEAIEFLRRGLLLEGVGSGERLDFVMRWQQLTGAVTAKGFEDTALYRYSVLLSLNEVGGDPGTPGVATGEFHQWVLGRRARWPQTMNATATHDTKRGEDARARLNVLSEVAADWERRLRRWSRWNCPRKSKVRGRWAPEPDVEALIYQTLVGAWPLDEQEAPAFRERLRAYVVKAAREAKGRTSWLDPNEAYERALLAFVDGILEDSPDNRFLADFLPFQRRVAYHGMLNSLAQAVLKGAAPGVPDLYQGTELWDLSLVDPDNRRPVDYEHRLRLLDDIERRKSGDRRRLVRELLASWADGRVKLYVTHEALGLRRARRDLFLDGDYIPLYARGDTANHVVAFARRWKGRWVIAAVPRLTVGLTRAGRPPLGPRVWGKCRLPLPPEAPRGWRNVFTGEGLEADGGLALSGVFESFPVALLLGADAGD